MHTVEALSIKLIFFSSGQSSYQTQYNPAPLTTAVGCFLHSLKDLGNSIQLALILAASFLTFVNKSHDTLLIWK